MIDWLNVILIILSAVLIAFAFLTYLPQHRNRKIKQTKNEFLEIRAYLKREQVRLTKLTFDYYKEKFKNQFFSVSCEIGNETFEASMLTLPLWIPSVAIPLENVKVSKDQSWANDMKMISNKLDLEHFEVYSGLENNLKSLEYLWPMTDNRSKILNYSDAVTRYDKPNLWWDSAGYRMTNIKVGEQFELVFRIGRYFALFDTLEALAFESAKADFSAQILRKNQINFESLKGRRIAGDPINLDQRCSYLGVATITLFGRDGDYRFVMHQRDMRKVAVAEGLVTVVPAGEFEPSADSDTMIDKDFDIWKNIMREFNEELINPTEGSEQIKYQIDWEKDSPFKELNQLRNEGNIQVFFLGFIISPLNLKPIMMTTIVFSSGTFDKIVPVRKEKNEEGNLLWIVKQQGYEGHKFDENGVKFFLSNPNLAPDHRACLIAAWNNRDKIIPQSNGKKAD